MLEVHALHALKDNFIYVLINPATDECAVVDPGEEAPARQFIEAQRLKLTDILCTHHHPDHIAGAQALAARFGARVWTSAFDKERIPAGTEIAREGASDSCLGRNFKVFEVPGHTHGQIAFWFSNDGMLFTGDTLFSMGCGRLFEGTAEEMFNSLQKLKSLPPETRVYFGHEYTLRNLEFVLSRTSGDKAALKHYQRECQARLARGQPTTPTTLGLEMKLNPFLTAASVEEFREWRSARDMW